MYYMLHSNFTLKWKVRIHRHVGAFGHLRIKISYQWVVLGIGYDAALLGGFLGWFDTLP